MRGVLESDGDGDGTVIFYVLCILLQLKKIFPDS